MRRVLIGALVCLMITAGPAGAHTWAERRERVIRARELPEAVEELTPALSRALRERTRILEAERAEYLEELEPDPVVVPSSESAPATFESMVDELAGCEAWGDWSYVGGDPYFFVLQFHPDTWLAHGGTQAELDAGVAPSRERLIEIGGNVFESSGWGAWPRCASNLGLR